MHKLQVNGDAFLFKCQFWLNYTHLSRVYSSKVRFVAPKKGCIFAENLRENYFGMTTFLKSCLSINRIKSFNLFLLVHTTLFVF